MHQIDPSLNQHGEVQSRYEAERLTAASVLIQAFTDYHRAKKLIRLKNLTLDQYFTLDDYEKRVIREGKLAWEWFKNKPRPRCTGWTLDDCCEVLKLEPSIIRRHYLTDVAYNDYAKNKNYITGGYHVYGEKNGRAKLNERQVKEIIVKYRTGDYSQEDLGREYNASQRLISDIVNGKRWGHVAA